jgi:CBS domain-containing protein
VQVKDVMMSVVGHVDVNMSLRDASATIKSLQMDPIPVLDDGKVVGLLAERDILALIAQAGVGGGMRPVRDAMTSDVLCCRPDQDVREAADAVKASAQTGGMERLPVVDDQARLIGLVARNALRGSGTGQDDGTQATDAVRSIDEAANFSVDPVQYMSDESFPASDPGPPPSTLGPNWDD